MQHKTKQIAKRKTVAVWGEECLEIKRDSVSYRTYQNYELHWHLHIKPALCKKLLDQVKPFGTAIALMLFAGLRSEEIMGLRWGDINQKKQVIAVRRVVTRVAKGEYMPVERTKNGKVRSW